MNKNFKTYLISLGLDPDELSDYWAERIEKNIVDQFNRAKDNSIVPPFGFKMRPLTYNEIICEKSEWIMKTLKEMLGKEVHCDYANESGRLIGIYTDELDYYYAVNVDGKTVYYSCVGGINLVNDL